MPVIWSSKPTANIKNNQTHLTWSVATQINNEKFSIEHSTDGSKYDEIGTALGDGNLATEKDYAYIHEHPSYGVNYYRIKQVDYDGKYDYSDEVSVLYEPDGQVVKIWPNPVVDDVKISTTYNTTVTITDLFGRTIKTT